MLAKLARGVTQLNGTGVYSGQDRPVLLCVVGRRQIIALKQIVAQIDPEAFVIVNDAREILGRGFTIPD